MKILAFFFILGLSINVFAHGYLILEPRPRGSFKEWLLCKSGDQWRIVHNTEDYCNVYNLSVSEQNKTVTFKIALGSRLSATWSYTEIVPLPWCTCSLCATSSLQAQQVEFDGIVQ
jgi:hypothetical protein